MSEGGANTGIGVTPGRVGIQVDPSMVGIGVVISMVTGLLEQMGSHSLTTVRGWASMCSIKDQKASNSQGAGRGRGRGRGSVFRPQRVNTEQGTSGLRGWGLGVGKGSDRGAPHKGGTLNSGPLLGQYQGARKRAENQHLEYAGPQSVSLQTLVRGRVVARIGRWPRAAERDRNGPKTNRQPWTEQGVNPPAVNPQRVKCAGPDK